MSGSVPGVPTRMRKIGPGQTRILTVPSILARHVADDTWFVAELTEDGILFCRVDGPSQTAGVPSWARENGAKS